MSDRESRPEWRRLDLLLWTAAVAAMLADAALTAYGVANGLSEANPLVRAAAATLGVAAGVLAVKLLTLSVGVAVRELLPPRHQVIIPAGLATPSAGATLINAAVLA